MKNLLETFRMIKIEHTLFALPFALVETFGLILFILFPSWLMWLPEMMK